MSAFDAEYEPSPWEPIEGEVALYERTGGAEPSAIVGDQWIILWTLGARSGKVRKTPLVRVSDGEGRYAVIGSMGGAPTHPQWVHNVRANPTARLQDGPERPRLLGPRGRRRREGGLVGPSHRSVARLRRLPGGDRTADPALRPRPDQLTAGRPLGHWPVNRGSRRSM